MKLVSRAAILVACCGLFASDNSAAENPDDANLVIDASRVPLAAQHAMESLREGGRIVQWEKQGRHYEAVVNKNGVLIGIEVTAEGKFLNRHDEKRED